MYALLVTVLDKYSVSSVTLGGVIQKKNTVCILYLYVNTQNTLSSGYKRLIQILKGIAEEKIQNYSAELEKELTSIR